MRVKRGCTSVAGAGWPALGALIVTNPEVNDPLRLVFIMLMAVAAMTTFALILPSLMGDHFAPIRLGVMLHEREVASPEPKKPTPLLAVV